MKTLRATRRGRRMRRAAGGTLTVSLCLSLSMTAGARADETVTGWLSGTANPANPVQIKQVTVSYDLTTGTVFSTIELFAALPAPEPELGLALAVVGQEPGWTKRPPGKAWGVIFGIGGPNTHGWESAAVHIGYNNKNTTVPVVISAGDRTLQFGVSDASLVEDPAVSCAFSNSVYRTTLIEVQKLGPTVFGPSVEQGCMSESLLGGIAFGEGALEREAQRQAELNTASEKARAEKEARERALREEIERTLHREGAPTGPRCLVPRLRGETLKEARRTLKRSHCRLGHIKRGHEDRAVRGGQLEVSAQSIPAGGLYPEGTAVGIQLARASKTARH